MTVISRDEFVSRIRRSEPAQERIRQLQAQVHEAVRASAVTGDKNWDHFLAAIEGRIKTYRDLIASEQIKLNNPLLVNGDEIMLLKVKLACLTSGMAALEEIIALPKIIIEQGAEAAGKLHGIADASENDSQKDSHYA